MWPLTLTQNKKEGVVQKAYTRGKCMSYPLPPEEKDDIDIPKIAKDASIIICF